MRFSGRGQMQTPPVEPRATLHKRAPEPFKSYDGDGQPIDLAAAQESRLRRLSPRRNRDEHVKAFDARVQELEQRQQELSTRLQELHGQRNAEPDLYRERLAAWLLDEKGPRPESREDTLAAEMEAGQTEMEALSRAIDNVTADKADYVRKHRKRLVTDAEKATERQYAVAVDAINHAEEALRTLSELRQSAVWAGCFPAVEANTHPVGHGILGGGLRRNLINSLGMDVRLDLSKMFEALRVHADWASTAANPEQRAILEAGGDPDARPPASGRPATWA